METMWEAVSEQPRTISEGRRTALIAHLLGRRRVDPDSSSVDLAEWPSRTFLLFPGPSQWLVLTEEETEQEADKSAIADAWKTDARVLAKATGLPEAVFVTLRTLGRESQEAVWKLVAATGASEILTRWLRIGKSRARLLTGRDDAEEHEIMVDLRDDMVRYRVYEL